MENKSKTLFIGAVIGALTGMFAAMLLNRRAESSERENALTTGEGLKLGVLVIGLLRAIASLGDD
jgi:gas vesicle protein